MNSALELQQGYLGNAYNQQVFLLVRINPPYLTTSVAVFCLWPKSYTLWIIVDAHWTHFLSWKPLQLALPAINQVRSFHNIFLIHLYCNILQIILTIDSKSIAFTFSLHLSTLLSMLNMLNVLIVIVKVYSFEHKGSLSG